MSNDQKNTLYTITLEVPARGAQLLAEAIENTGVRAADAMILANLHWQVQTQWKRIKATEDNASK
jgi:hypothetical protein